MFSPQRERNRTAQHQSLRRIRYLRWQKRLIKLGVHTYEVYPVRIRANGFIAIPPRLLKRYQLHVGDDVDIDIVEGRVLLKPVGATLKRRCVSDR